MRAHRPTRLENILQSKTTYLSAFPFKYIFSILISFHITVSSGVSPKRASGATPPLSASARGASIRLGTKVTFRLSFINYSFYIDQYFQWVHFSSPMRLWIYQRKLITTASGASKFFQRLICNQNLANPIKHSRNRVAEFFPSGIPMNFRLTVRGQNCW